MKKIRSKSDKDSSIIMHIGLGVLLSLITMFLMSIILTVMVERETISIVSAPAFGIGIHAVSVFVGSMIALALEKGRIAVVAGVIAVCYLVILLCVNMLIFSSGFAGIGTGIISASAGGLIAVLIKGKMSGKNKHRMKVHSR